MRCHLATAVTIQTPSYVNPIEAAVHFATRPLSDGLNLADHLVAGAAAAAAATAAMHPMDTVKTLIQKAAPATATASGATAVVPQKSLNMFTAVLTTLRVHGIPGLYKGLAASMAGQVPSGAIKFAAFESLTQLSARLLPQSRDSPLMECTCAALAFVAGSVALIPAEVLKQRLQAGIYTSMPSAITTIFRKEGLRAFYTGYNATLLRDVPYTMFEFGLYQQFKRSFRYALRRDKLTPSQELAMGGLAGGCTGFITTPLDLAKTRLMTQTAGSSRQYKGVLDVLIKVARQEGLPGLFKGSSTRVVWLVPFTAVYFGVHEASKRAMRSRKQTTVQAPHRKSTKTARND